MRHGRTSGRSRLARTLSRARWREYRSLLVSAREEGYVAVRLEDWLTADGPDEARRTLVLRHDVDQHPRSALTMAAIEQELGVSSTWYFRWRTAHPAVIGPLRRQGFGIGLHYETSSRHALAEESDELGPLREELREEVRAFSERHGPIKSIAPHGDSRVPETSNAALMKGQDPSDYGVEFDANEAMRGRRLGFWLTDRSAADGGWKDGVDPAVLLRDGVTPILCLTHPNNWVSGPSLWVGRFFRTGSDTPPL